MLTLSNKTKSSREIFFLILAQIADLPRENEQELINVFAYVIDIIEESDDPWQLDAQVVDNDFIILCRNKASIHLPPEHVYTLKLWLLR